ncbi:MAG: DUF4349 domain-containing protein [Lachnospiraceae bacterium]|nr:DUF4349 domain-containing protein [Lachnospiraceae bacterium]
MKKWKVLSLAAILGLVLAGCGGSSNKYADTPAAVTEEAYDTGTGYLSDDIYSYAQENGYAAEEPAEALEAKTDGSESPEVADTSRKLIKNVDLEVETEEFDDLLTTIEQKTEALAGYIEESYTYNGSAYRGRSTRNASLTIRIPAGKLNTFLSEVAEVSNVISRNERVTDVTLQYVDMESHKKALVAEQDRLLELLEQAENIEDIISIESRLSEVRYQIESMESQLRTMDNQVSYSTINLSIEEVKQLTPVKEQSVGEKIATGFWKNLTRVGAGILNFVIGLIISIPYVLLWGIIIAIVVFIIRSVLKKNRSRKVSNKVSNKPEEEKEKQKNE